MSQSEALEEFDLRYRELLMAADEVALPPFPVHEPLRRAIASLRVVYSPELVRKSVLVLRQNDDQREFDLRAVGELQGA